VSVTEVQIHPYAGGEILMASRIGANLIAVSMAKDGEGYGSGRANAYRGIISCRMSNDMIVKIPYTVIVTTK